LESSPKIITSLGYASIFLLQKESTQTDIQKVENTVPSAATEHGLSRHTAQNSISSEEVVDDRNPYSLQLFQTNLSPIFNICMSFTFSQQLTTKYPYARLDCNFDFVVEDFINIRELSAMWVLMKEERFF